MTGPAVHAPAPATTRVLGVIPARLASTRLPGKVLRMVAGEPLLAWVYRAACSCPQIDQVLIAADSPEVEAACLANGWPVQMTSPALPSGTDRLHEVSQHHPAGIYVNIQGDEPLLAPEHIAALLAPFALPHVDVTTLKVRCTPEEIDNPNAVKVVTATDGRALYFSRATIPYDRDRTGHSPRFKHIGWRALRPSLPVRWNRLSGWSSFACLKTVWLCTLRRPARTPSASIRRRIYTGWNRFYCIA
jgi:3-deoxy-manno-octulosonate cytidylyltransferase (CMP-KDO synthetase)